MAGVGSSEILVPVYQTTRRHIREGSNFRYNIIRTLIYFCTLHRMFSRDGHSYRTIVNCMECRRHQYRQLSLDEFFDEVRYLNKEEGQQYLVVCSVISNIILIFAI
jgi:hypothetical protein